MNKKDFEDYIVSSREYIYHHTLPKDHEIIQHLIALYNEGKISLTNEDIKKEIKNMNYLGDYYWTDNSSWTGSKLTFIRIDKRNNEGMLYTWKYKNITFNVICDLNDKVVKSFCIYPMFHESRLWNELEGNTIEELYQDAIRLIKISKREGMNFFNLKIKELKQDSELHLKEHNDILKQLD